MGSLEGDLSLLAIESIPKDAILYVNGVRHVLPEDAAHLTLLEYLRKFGLTGTKLGCGEGGCGACTVMVSSLYHGDRTIIHRAVNACLAPLYSVEGMHVVTVEGIGNARRGLHPVQEALSNAHGSQCGFCTPGFIMSMYTLLRSSCKRPPTQEEIEESLAGNLCRCTGYRPIVDAFRVFAKSDSAVYHDDSALAAGASPVKNVSANGTGFICPSTGKPCDCGKADTEKGNEVNKNDHIHKGLTKRSDSSGELIYPPELLTRKAPALRLKGFNGMMWYRPLRLQDLLDLKFENPEAKLVVGNTEVGIETRFKNVNYPVVIAATHVPELNATTIKDDGIEIGSSVTLAKVLEVIRECVKQREPHEVSACLALMEQLKWFAGTQIRNVASVGGNICTASPISDLNPLWMAARATFTLMDHTGTLRTVQAKDFFIGYRKVAMKKTEVLTSVFLPWTRRHEYVKEFKQAHRRDDDIALVNAGMRVLLSKLHGTWMISEASLAFGGVAPVSLSAPTTETFLKGKPWNQLTLEGALIKLREEVLIADNAPGGMVEFRRSLMLSFLFKFFVHTTYKLESEANLVHDLPETYRSAAIPFQREPSRGLQYFKPVVNGTAVGLPLMHTSARLQVSGEAEYVDDLNLPPNCLHAALVLSSRPHARIISIDATEAQSIPGFEGLFTVKDVPGRNDIGAVVYDEELFVSEVVTCVGQAIGIVVATTYEAAKAASKKVKIEYEDLPPILSIQQALEANSFLPGTERLLEKGNVPECFESGICDHVIEGTVRVGGQEHFYLEPNASIVWTADGGNEVVMLSSTQAPQKHQKYVAHVLGLPMHKVVCKTKRIGGGFGGKETKSAFLAAAASVPAYLLKQPVRLVLERDVDMAITGERHAFLGKYKVGFSKEGKVLALDLKIYNNGGNSLDLSHSVLERAMFNSDNVYEIPNVRVFGRVCYTNLPSNTAFRGFGAPQAMIIAENWIERIACVVKRSPIEIREMNFQKEGCELHYGQKLELSRLDAVWDSLKMSSEYLKRFSEIDNFNSLHRWKKRGLGMIPTKFGISFTTKLLNQAGALVQVYTDGTVLVTHGGVEMGQGLHTKVAQIAATAFDIPMSSVFISETSTDKVPNASPTAASASSDMYGAAVLDACEQLKKRMEPISSKKAYSSFAELVNACYIERIDLSAHGFYITPDIGFDWQVGKGRPFNYFTFGAACAEVEVDCLTGDFYLRRADICMDLGSSLNPAIDIGQVEGAFVQGLGWVALEELKWGDPAHPWVKPGHLFTQGPGTYKLPTVNDIPVDFRVSLLEDAPNPRAIHSSKAVGEPPLFLAASAFFAIKEAISAARREVGLDKWFVLDSPATPERIRLACSDQFTKHFINEDFIPKLSI
ncbi:hypothetical protein O6H91_21G020900 [Diphasiastrum complanatum]|uniref:Uncharacterized protein n=11 Tax=Diphasiastrum complanatum TaxID=34168 RepID=A0ACC2AKC8_DIPCM|nr:hypothetical protein O6H91_21G020900 [Diphasiastrum complanatum]KAJ7517367.1 hypothetical protein O6H91_21G020900 [Diphasiastrum complanatum]KAJ7517368.1 hypothetical protein O6H91_21G020900 [Diphasiastrum complanatum]KAJ7517369.1 hypothetical protein O6H91_21G020900 [Diphasiastrum complanatum]KAJ7517370.1 hypothetical protein O6H91_21G020900 [Diphasiastrum complanatum]